MHRAARRTGRLLRQRASLSRRHQSRAKATARAMTCVASSKKTRSQHSQLSQCLNQELVLRLFRPEMCQSGPCKDACSAIRAQKRSLRGLANKDASRVDRSGKVKKNAMGLRDHKKETCAELLESGTKSELIIPARCACNVDHNQRSANTALR